MTWTAYHRTSDINEYLEYLAKTYPDLCSIQTIGKSTQGRPLILLRISNGKPTNQAIWIDGGIHAREWVSPASVTYIIDRLVEDWDVQPDYIQNIDYYIFPVANPDGYEFTHTNNRLWRKNLSSNKGNWFQCKGTDLNRNFGYHWGEMGQSRQPCSVNQSRLKYSCCYINSSQFQEIFSGENAFSEPESKAQQNFFANSAAPFKAFLTFHSYGQYILYPWGYDRSVPTDVDELDRVGKLGAERMKSIGGMDWQVGPSGK
jgi:carboxypeptidase A4